MRTADIERRIAALERAVASEQKRVFFTVKFVSPEGEVIGEMTTELGARPASPDMAALGASRLPEGGTC